MAKVIQIPTHHNRENLAAEAVAQSVRVEAAAMADGSMMIVLGDTELWLEFNQAADMVELLSETLKDAFENLREKALADLAENGGVWQ